MVAGKGCFKVCFVVKPLKYSIRIIGIALQFFYSFLSLFIGVDWLSNCKV
jgi:hypothetical protein